MRRLLGGRFFKSSAEEIAEKWLCAAYLCRVILQAHADVGQFHRLFAPFIKEIECSLPHALPQQIRLRGR